jgi:hypothetical protein
MYTSKKQHQKTSNSWHTLSVHTMKLVGINGDDLWSSTVTRSIHPAASLDALTTVAGNSTDQNHLIL